MTDEVRRLKAALKLSLARCAEAEFHAAQMGRSLEHATTHNQRMALRKFRGSACFDRIVSKHGEFSALLADFNS